MESLKATLRPPHTCVTAWVFYMFSLLVVLQVDTDAAEDSRIPVPDAGSLAVARERVESAFVQERTNAIRIEQRKALAKAYFKVALESKGDPDSQFALLLISAETATSVGDASLTMQSIDELAARFQIQRGAFSINFLNRLSLVASTSEKNKILDRM